MTTNRPTAPNYCCNCGTPRDVVKHLSATECDISTHPITAENAAVRAQKDRVRNLTPGQMRVALGFLAVWNVESFEAAASFAETINT